jgi:hypothetical protein
MRLRTVSILIVLGILFVAFATHPKEVGAAIGHAAYRVVHAFRQ